MTPSSAEPMRTLVLTGAGFSAAAGLPVERDVLPAAMAYCQQNGLTLAARLQDLWTQYLSPTDFTTLGIEDVLTEIQRRRLAPGSQAREGNNLLDLEAGMVALMSKALFLPKNEIPTVYFDFLANLPSPITIATLNQDLLLEHCFEQLGTRWSYGLAGDDVEYMLGDMSRLYARTPTPGGTTYWKLHGSFNWHSCPACECLRVCDRTLFGVSGVSLCPYDRFTVACTRCPDSPYGQRIMGTVLVPPTILKEYDVKHLDQLWADFAQALLTVDDLILIGLSFRPEETRLRAAMAKAIQADRRPRNIIVINPDVEAIDRTRALVGPPIQPHVNLQAYVDSLSAGDNSTAPYRRTDSQVAHDSPTS